MSKNEIQEENEKIQTMKDIKKTSKKEVKEDKSKKKKHMDWAKIVATIIVSILVAIMLFGACASLIYYIQYYA